MAGDEGLVNIKTSPTPAVAASKPVVEPQVPRGPDPINGWVPDKSKPCWGLPGAVAPTGYFDPLGFCQKGISLNDVKRTRESEVMHGRVAMLGE
jgi:hypothetical protein